MTLSKLRVAAASNLNMSNSKIIKKFLAQIPDHLKVFLDPDSMRSIVKNCRKTSPTTLMAHKTNAELHPENLVFEESSAEEELEPENAEEEEEEKKPRNFYEEGPNLTIDVVGTMRGGVKIQCEGYMYTAKNKTRHRIFWSCIKQKTCKARIATLNDYMETKIGILKTAHTHEPDQG